MIGVRVHPFSAQRFSQTSVKQAPWGKLESGFLRQVLA